MSEPSFPGADPAGPQPGPERPRPERPGAELPGALEGLDDAVLRGLDDSPLVEVIVAAERQVAYLQAVQMRAMVELSRRQNYGFCGGCDDADENSIGHEHSRIRAVGSELSAALSWTPGRADRWAALAIELVEELPDTLAALAAGQIDARRAELIAEKTRVLSPAPRSRVEQQALLTAPEQTTTQLGRSLDRRVIAADPTTAERRRQRGRADRRVEPPRPSGNADGMAELALIGPAEDVTAFYTAVDAAARHARQVGKAHGDARTLDHYRFDIVTGLGWTALTLGHLGCCAPRCATGTSSPAQPDISGDNDAAHHEIDQATQRGGLATAQICGPAIQNGGLAAQGSGPSNRRRSKSHNELPAPRLATRHRRPAVVHVTVPLTTLAGADDEPAELDGYGPIPADAARLIAADATLRRLLTDPADGQLLEYGRATYAPPQTLADFVIARDRTCRFPTTTTPARSCDLDHRRSYRLGGTTGASNLQALSRRAHLDKTLHGWRVRLSSQGNLVWTSPAGLKYRTPPEPIGPTQPRPPDDPDPPPF